MNAKPSRRLVIIILSVFAFLLAGILFWPIILNDIINPISLVTWFLLRILVLSIDQKYYWGALIFVILIFLYRFLRQEQTDLQLAAPEGSNSTLKTIEYWRQLFTYIHQSAWDEKNLNKELVRLLISVYATRQHGVTNFEIYEALQQGEIPLPETIHSYLFREEPRDRKRSLKKLIQSLRKAPQQWLRRRTGQDKVEHDRMVDEVLCFFETALEIKHDNGKTNPN